MGHCYKAQDKMRQIEVSQLSIAYRNSKQSILMYDP